MNGRRILLIGATSLLLGSCGDDDTFAPTPTEAEAISSLIDAELSTDEQRCMLEGLLESEISPDAVVEGSLSGEDDATVLAVAIECVDDLAQIPAFVDSFIDGAAAEGVTLTDAEARCAIDSLGKVDPTTAITDCITVDSDSGAQTFADDALLDLLSTACENGNNQACDELYATAPDGSDYLETGRTCAGQLPDSVGNRCFEDLDA
jgi:hypothetical protein